jgi:hypothetical protein
MRSVDGAGTDAVAIGANNITLCELDRQCLSRLQHCSALCQAKRLERRVAMVEIHLVGPKPAAAGRTGNIAHAPQKCERVRLTLSDPPYLAVTILCVVTAIRAALIWKPRH